MQNQARFVQTNALLFSILNDGRFGNSSEVAAEGIKNIGVLLFLQIKSLFLKYNRVAPMIRKEATLHEGKDLTLLKRIVVKIAKRLAHLVLGRFFKLMDMLGIVHPCFQSSFPYLQERTSFTASGRGGSQ